MIAKRYGASWALGLGKAHEDDTSSKYWYDSQVDLHNNFIGAYVGSTFNGLSDDWLGRFLAEAVRRRNPVFDYTGGQAVSGRSSS